MSVHPIARQGGGLGSGRKRLAAVTLASSVAALVAVPVWWAAARTRIDVGTVPAARSSPQPTGRVAAGRPGVPAIAVSSARLVDRPRTAQDPRPTRVRVAAIGIDAAIVPIGIEERTMAMQIPADISTVGWYRFGPSPGEAGSSLLVGHVDSSALGPGVFFRLREVRLGSTVSIEFVDGTSARFRVVARRIYPKGDLPQRVFVRSGAPVLTLVTCGGPFDRSTGHYLDNVVVYAVPAGG